MKENIFWVTTAKIKDGELDNLKALMKEMTESTNTNEPGTVNYEWFMDADQKYCHLIENFTDSEAAISHLKSFFKEFGKKFMSALEIKSFTVYGDPSGELIKMLTPMGAVIMNLSEGFRR